jgi:DNA modification methylase
MTLLINESTADVSYETENGGSLVESAGDGIRQIIITSNEMVSLPGAVRVASKTPLKISVSGKRHSHPTTKPLDLMQYLVRLVTPPGGTCLDPFAGTGTTGEAAWREGMSAVLIERDAEYCADIRRRMKLALASLTERRVAGVKQAPDYGPLFGGKT